MFLKIKEIYKELSFPEIQFSFPKIEEQKEVKCHYQELKMPIIKNYYSICYKVEFSKYPKEKRRMLSYYLRIFLEMNFSIISFLYEELIKEKVIDSSLSYDYDFLGDYLFIYVCGYANKEEIFVKRIREVFESAPVFNEEVFDLDLKSEKMHHLCSDISLYGLSRQFHENYSYYHYPDFDSREDLQTLNFSEFKTFIEDLEFKEYLVTKITDSE